MKKVETKQAFEKELKEREALIDFDEATHTYTIKAELDGKEIIINPISATTILGKMGISEDYAKLNIDAEVLKNKADYGTAVHLAIEMFIKNGTIPKKDEIGNTEVKLFRNAILLENDFDLDETDKVSDIRKGLLSETKLNSDIIAGTMDIYDWDKKMVKDIKNTYNTKAKSFAYQLGLYNHLLNEAYGLPYQDKGVIYWFHKIKVDKFDVNSQIKMEAIDIKLPKQEDIKNLISCYEQKLSYLILKNKNVSEATYNKIYDAIKNRPDKLDYTFKYLVSRITKEELDDILLNFRYTETEFDYVVPTDMDKYFEAIDSKYKDLRKTETNELSIKVLEDSQRIVKVNDKEINLQDKAELEKLFDTLKKDKPQNSVEIDAVIKSISDVDVRVKEINKDIEDKSKEITLISSDVSKDEKTIKKEVKALQTEISKLASEKKSIIETKYDKLIEYLSNDENMEQEEAKGYDYCIIHCETTGFFENKTKPIKDQLENVEILHYTIMGVKDNKEEILYSKYFNSEYKKSWEDATKHNGITPEMVKDKPVFNPDTDAKEINAILKNSKNIVYSSTFARQTSLAYGINAVQGKEPFENKIYYDLPNLYNVKYLLTEMYKNMSNYGKVFYDYTDLKASLNEEGNLHLQTGNAFIDKQGMLDFFGYGQDNATRKTDRKEDTSIKEETFIFKNVLKVFNDFKHKLYDIRKEIVKCKGSDVSFDMVFRTGQQARLPMDIYEKDDAVYITLTYNEILQTKTNVKVETFEMGKFVEFCKKHNVVDEKGNSLIGRFEEMFKPYEKNALSLPVINAKLCEALTNQLNELKESEQTDEVKALESKLEETIDKLKNGNDLEGGFPPIE